MKKKKKREKEIALFFKIDFMIFTSCYTNLYPNKLEK